MKGWSKVQKQFMGNPRGKRRQARPSKWWINNVENEWPWEQGCQKEAEGYHEVEREARVLWQSVPPPPGKQSRPSKVYPQLPFLYFQDAARISYYNRTASTCVVTADFRRPWQGYHGTNRRTFHFLLSNEEEILWSEILLKIWKFQGTVRSSSTAQYNAFWFSFQHVILKTRQDSEFRNFDQTVSYIRVILCVTTLHIFQATNVTTV
jgi:hypothetical protein